MNIESCYLAEMTAHEDVARATREGLARPGDVAISISTSGNSENVVRALSTARIQEMHILIGHMLCGVLESDEAAA